MRRFFFRFSSTANFYLNDRPCMNLQVCMLYVVYLIDSMDRPQPLLDANVNECVGGEGRLKMMIPMLSVEMPNPIPIPCCYLAICV